MSHIRRTSKLSPLDPEQLLALVDGLVDAAVLVDPDLHPLHWNHAYTQLCGIGRRKARTALSDPAVRCIDLVELGVEHDRCLVRRAMEKGRSLRMNDITARTPKSTPIAEHVVIANAIPLHDADGNAVGGIETYRDVTAEARMHRRYKKLLQRERTRAEELEHQVQLRTADLERSIKDLERTKDRLVQSEKLSSLGRLVAGLAHELNNPINFVYGNTQHLRDYVNAYREVLTAYAAIPLSAEDHRRISAVRADAGLDYIDRDMDKLLAAVSSGAERAVGIIRDLRRFLHGGKTNMFRPVDILRAAQSAANLVSKQVEPRVSVEVIGGEDLPPINGNEGQLGQVLMNLLINAAEAIEHRGGIVVDVYGKDEGVCIRVADDGSGIEPENLDRICDPFFTTKPVGEGTGLGLSISYSIVQSHGGTLSVDSTYGEGTSVTVWLPASEAR